jgi:hypothetical protein
MPEKRTTGKHVAPVTSGEIVAPVFTKTEARKFTDSIRADVQALWEKVVEAYERKAWAALGYGSFAAYMYDEFGYGKAHAYRLLDAGSIVRELTPPPPPPPESPERDWRAEDRERNRRAEIERAADDLRFHHSDVAPPTTLAQALALRPLSNQRRNELAETWKQIVEAYGPDVTGAEVRRSVQARLEETKPPEQRLPWTLQEFNRELGSLHYHAEQLLPQLDADDYDPDEVEFDQSILECATPEFLAEWRKQVQESIEALTRVLDRLG